MSSLETKAHAAKPSGDKDRLQTPDALEQEPALVLEAKFNPQALSAWAANASD